MTFTLWLKMFLADLFLLLFVDNGIRNKEKRKEDADGWKTVAGILTIGVITSVLGMIFTF